MLFVLKMVSISPFCFILERVFWIPFAENPNNRIDSFAPVTSFLIVLNICKCFVYCGIYLTHIILKCIL